MILLQILFQIIYIVYLIIKQFIYAYILILIFLNIIYYNNKHIKDVIDNIYQFGYHTLINKFTRITYTSKSIIDNIYTNNNNIPYINCLLMSDVSDNLPIIVLYKNQFNINNNNKNNLIILILIIIKLKINIQLFLIDHLIKIILTKLEMF